MKRINVTFSMFEKTGPYSVIGRNGHVYFKDCSFRKAAALAREIPAVMGSDAIGLDGAVGIIGNGRKYSVTSYLFSTGYAAIMQRIA